MAKNQSQEESTISHLTVKIPQAISLVTKLIKAKKVPMIHGSPALGKSAIVKQIAAEYNLMLIDLRLSQCDPTDILGFPQIVNGRAGYVPMDTFPIEGDELPINPVTGKPYAGWLLFLDEFNSASVAVQAASYKVVLDRMVGKYHLHPKCAVVAAGNLETDGAIVEPMSTALQSRIVHMDIECCPIVWSKYASAAHYDHRIISFIEFKPGLLYTFRPDHTDRTYAAPRTWEFAHDYLAQNDVKDADTIPALSGMISEGVAREFLLFCDIYTNLPTIADIIAAPEQIRVSSEPSILFAITGSIANHATKTNLDPLLKYVFRLPLEFQIVCVRQTLARNKALLDDASMQKWLAVHATDLF
jgi:hypothetical protein